MGFAHLITTPSILVMQTASIISRTSVVDSPFPSSSLISLVPDYRANAEQREGGDDVGVWTSDYSVVMKGGRATLTTRIHAARLT